MTFSSNAQSHTLVLTAFLAFFRTYLKVIFNMAQLDSLPVQAHEVTSATRYNPILSKLLHCVRRMATDSTKHTHSLLEEKGGPQ